MSRKSLLLHSCCGPCSTSVLEILTKYFDVDIFFYNPSIQPKEEYMKRLHTQLDVIDKMDLNDKVNSIIPEYNTEKFESIARPYCNSPEGGLRCRKCIEQRIMETAKYAKYHNYDVFATTLSDSEYKNSDMIFDCQFGAMAYYKIPFVPLDFELNGGNERGKELTKLYGLYEQDYCGCLYGKKMMEQDKK